MTRQIWFQNRQNIEKIVPQKTKEAQNVVFNLKGRIPLLFYCVKHIHGQFKTYLKPAFLFSNKYSKKYLDCSMGKTCRDILLNPFCFVPHRFLNLYDNISFDMSSFHCSVWRSDRCIVFSKVVK
jgi:hypothetical protein